MAQSPSSALSKSRRASLPKRLRLPSIAQMSACVSVTARGVSSELMNSFSERSELLVPQRLLLSANVRQRVCHFLCDMPTSDESEVGGRSGVAGFDVAQLLSGDLEAAEIVLTDEHGAID